MKLRYKCKCGAEFEGIINFQHVQEGGNILTLMPSTEDVGRLRKDATTWMAQHAHCYDNADDMIFALLGGDDDEA